MKCWNCGGKIADGAKFCMHCEADTDKMEDVSMEDVAEMMKSLPPEAMAEIASLAEQHDLAEDFVNAIFVGTCPECDSSDVGTYEDVADINDCTVARCFKCGHNWCTECGQPVKVAKDGCEHWQVCEKCEHGNDECEYMFDYAECPKIEKWLDKKLTES